MEEERAHSRVGGPPDGKLEFHKKLAYSVGHIYNDLIAACYMSYISIFLHIEFGLEPKYSGYLIFASQASDTVVNPIIGIIQDKCNSGKRLIFYIVGAVFNSVYMLLMFNFNEDFVTVNDSTTTLMSYYLPLVVLGGTSYTFMQLTNLAILPEMSSSELDRIQLNSWRNAWTLVSNIVVYCGVWLLLLYYTGSNNVTKLTANDAFVFKLLSSVIIGAGLLTSFIFFVFIRTKPFACSCEYRKTGFNECETQTEETHLVRNSPKHSDPNENDKEMHIKREKCEKDVTEAGSVRRSYDGDLHIEESDKTPRETPSSWIWTMLRSSLFYQVAIIYSCTKFSVLISQIYIPLYVIETLQMDKSAIGILPLMFYVSGFVTSLLMRKLNQKFDIQRIFIFGEISTLGGCVWVYFITPSSYEQVYGASLVLGIGQATLNVTSMAMVTLLIGDNVEKSGTVFGIIGFAENLLQTISLLTLQLLYKCSEGPSSMSCGEFYKIVMLSVPAISTVIAFVMMIMRYLQDKAS